jgi:hypothetical protein
MSSAETTLQDLEDVRERQFWSSMLRVTAIVCIVLVVGGGSFLVTVTLGGQAYGAIAMIGLLAGGLTSAAMVASPRSREVTIVVLGAVTLPLLGAYLAGIAARGGVALTEYSAGLYTLVATGLAAVLSGLWIARIWRGRAARAAEISAGQEMIHAGEGGTG